ncbi:hypothetical protein TDB9533_02467 [Thalassocella blandensis]|nr:hypothetical protein TDB9533_02467 [Thalassocella blandensis]
MLLYKVRRHLVAFILGANTLSLLGCLFAYVAISYLLLAFSGEKALIAHDVFLYWLVVTASTVGYGDFSPTTDAGRLVTALFIIPAGLSLFAIGVGRVGLYLSDMIQKGKRGLRMTRASNHCVIIGWNGQRTMRLINLLLTKENGHQEKIVLCHNTAMDNPLPSKIEFVKVDGYTDDEEMKRAAIDQAARIIVDTQQDDITLATALFCHNQNPSSHIAVYFKDDDHAGLIRAYCPKVEVVPSVSIEMIARASVDPGSANLHQNLLDPAVDASQFSFVLKTDSEHSFSELITHFRDAYQAIPIAIRKLGTEEVDINPTDDVKLLQGDVIYYIADKRIQQL